MPSTKISFFIWRSVYLVYVVSRGSRNLSHVLQFRAEPCWYCSYHGRSGTSNSKRLPVKPSRVFKRSLDVTISYSVGRRRCGSRCQKVFCGGITSVLLTLELPDGFLVRQNDRSPKGRHHRFQFARKAHGAAETLLNAHASDDALGGRKYPQIGAAIHHDHILVEVPNRSDDGVGQRACL